MVASKAVKKNISSMQVIKTLQLLLEGNYSMGELVEKLNQNEPEPVFNNSVVSKYINTCRFCGIEILKIYNRYFVTNLPFGLNLTQKDMELLHKLQIIAKDKLTKKPNNIFESFITNLNKYSNKTITKVEKKISKMTYELFDKAISQKRKIVLMYRTKASLECIPVGIIEDKNKTFFEVIYNGKNKKISTERIAGIEILDKRFKNNEISSCEVVFKLTGRLAKSYTKREHEKIVIQNLPEYITVSNVGEDKKDLLSRLLRYDSSCEIVSPQAFRDEMKNTLDNMLKNYGE